MTMKELEKRLAALEAEVKELRAKVATPPSGGSILDLFGTYADDPTFEEATRLGREWRERGNKESLEEFDREQAREAAANGATSHKKQPKAPRRRGANAGA